MGAEFDNSRRKIIVGRRPDGYTSGNFDVFGNKVVRITDMTDGQEMETYILYEPKEKPAWMIAVEEQPTMGD